MRGWRPATWVFLIWAVLFPAVWLVLLLNARGDEGESLRVMDVIFFGLVGAGIWIAGIAVVFLVWELDHWFVERRRR